MTPRPETGYNPDVLSCIANLSNDEVFTPPEVANAMIDLLPQELFRDPTTTFLDPACKSGVFLREIAKRLLKGLEPVYPDLQERVDHIFRCQLFGIAITELTAHLSRRSVYCSKTANGDYSITQFDTVDGNIRFQTIKHKWENGKCVFCGASRSGYDRTNDLESHAYEMIHTTKPKELFNMRFDVIISNPPYQLKVNESGKGLGAVPIYQRFVEQAQRLNPRYITMIIPARWFSGGVGLDDFRKNMLSNRHIRRIVDYIDSKDCFAGVDINGGVCYFLIDRSYNGDCEYTNVSNSTESSAMRNLREFEIFVRRNEALSIIHKVLSKHEKMLSAEGGCSPQTPYGFLSTYWGSAKKETNTDCELLGSKGWSYVRRNEVLKSKNTIDLYKPMISKLSCEHAGNPDKSGMYRVLSRMEILKPNQICNQSYLTICPQKNETAAINVYNYLRTKLVRFLILQTLAGMNLSINNFKFVPWQRFDESWDDKKLYQKYGLSSDEIDFIDSIIRPMEGGDI